MCDLQELIVEATSDCVEGHDHDLSEFEQDDENPTIWRAYCYECTAKVAIDLDAPVHQQINGLAAHQDCNEVIANQSDAEDDEDDPEFELQCADDDAWDRQVSDD